MAKRGPKTKELNWDEFDKLCALQCTLEEIASFMNCSADTIERCVKRQHGIKFAEYYKQKSQVGKISLRRQMFKKMQEGNVVMMIWLSKQWLGFSDKAETLQTIKGEVKVDRDEIKRLAADPEALEMIKRLEDKLSPVTYELPKETDKESQT